MDGDRDSPVIRCAELMKDVWDHIRASPIPRGPTAELSISQSKAMTILNREQLLSMGDLASALGINISSASHLVDRLVDKGLIQRSEDPEDRRLVLCSPTEAGKQWGAEKAALDMKELGAVAALLDPEELNLVARAMEALDRALRDRLKKNRVASRVESS